MADPTLLTPGAVSKMVRYELTGGDPIVQVLDVRRLLNSDRWTGHISDGECKHQCSFSKQLMLSSNGGGGGGSGLVANSILRLRDYLVNKSSAATIIVIIAADIVRASAQQIGKPVPVGTISHFRPTATATATATAAGGAPHKTNSTSPPDARADSKSAAGGVTAGSSSSGGNRRSGSGGAVGAMIAVADSKTVYTPISAINQYSNHRWTIKVRVTAKTEMKHWQKKDSDSSGKFFSVELLDAGGSQIRATAFQEAADRLYPVLQLDRMYAVSRCTVKTVDRTKPWNRNAPCDYELSMNADTLVQSVENDHSIKAGNFDFVPISDVARIEPEQSIDIIGVCVAVEPITVIIAKKTSKEIKKRQITIRDDSNKQIDVTLWAEVAEEYHEGVLSDSPIVVIKSAKVSSFAGRSLSVGFGGRIMINPPDVDRAAHLKNWWMENGKHSTADSLTSHGGGHGHAAKDPITERRIVVADIKEQNLGFDPDKKSGDFVNVRAWIPQVRYDSNREPWYKACVQLVPDSCHGRPPADPNATRECAKKVQPAGGGGGGAAAAASSSGSGSGSGSASESGGGFMSGFMCQSCGLVDSYKPRYILNLDLRDQSGHVYATAFNDVARSVMDGRDATVFAALSDEGKKAEIEAAFFAKPASLWTFTLRVKGETNQHENRQRIHVVSAKPVDFAVENARLILGIEAVCGPL